MRERTSKLSAADREVMNARLETLEAGLAAAQKEKEVLETCMKKMRTEVCCVLLSLPPLFLFKSDPHPA